MQDIVLEDIGIRINQENPRSFWFSTYPENTRFCATFITF